MVDSIKIAFLISVASVRTIAANVLADWNYYTHAGMLKDGTRAKRWVSLKRNIPISECRRDIWDREHKNSECHRIEVCYFECLAIVVFWRLLYWRHTIPFDLLPDAMHRVVVNCKFTWLIRHQLSFLFESADWHWKVSVNNVKISGKVPY